MSDEIDDTPITPDELIKEMQEARCNAPLSIGMLSKRALPPFRMTIIIFSVISSLI
jgi:hypothetical protein